MKEPRIGLPTGQNWSCHGCTGCCRHPLVVPLTAQDKLRIERQYWTAADGVNPASLLVRDGDRFVLRHQADGACVFLDPSGRCRIHAKFGAEAKPLACRLYPLVFHPAGGKIAVGLRFSCPSAAGNRGDPLSEQSPAIQKLAALVVPADYREEPPPPVHAGPAGEWADLLCFVKWLDTSLAEPETPLALKFPRALHWLGAVEKGRLDQISGPDLDEILGALAGAAARKLPTLPACPAAPSRFGRVFLRLLVLEHARMTTVADLQQRSRYRWQMLSSGLRFACAFGRTTALRSGLASVRFADLEGPFELLSPAVEAMLTRFFRVKIQSLHFCGRAFHGLPLIEGFRNLAMLYPTILWLARWHAQSHQRTDPSEPDVAAAISMVDHHHGYSPYLPWRIRLLNQRNDIARLCAWRRA